MNSLWVMSYYKGGLQIEHKIYAQNLVEAKQKARAISEKNNVGIMFSLEYSNLNRR